MNINQITGIEVNYTKLPKGRSNSMHPEAVKYRKAFARINNALEGVVLNDNDKKFMDNIPLDISNDDFKKAVLARLTERRNEF